MVWRVAVGRRALVLETEAAHEQPLEGIAPDVVKGYQGGGQRLVGNEPPLHVGESEKRQLPLHHTVGVELAEPPGPPRLPRVAHGVT